MSMFSILNIFGMIHILNRLYQKVICEVDGAYRPQSGKLTDLLVATVRICRLVTLCGP